MEIHADHLPALDSAIQAGMDDGDTQITNIVGNLYLWMDDSLKPSDQAHAKIGRKVNSAIVRSQTLQANGLDHVSTNLAGWTHNNIAHHDWTLAGLGAKAGVIEPGQSVDDADFQGPDGQSLGPEVGGTVILDCRGLAGQLEPLIEVLREIRDRIGGTPVVIPGESPETAKIEAGSYELVLADASGQEHAPKPEVSVA